jgi:hypothetical protein
MIQEGVDSMGRARARVYVMGGADALANRRKEAYSELVGGGGQ